MGNFEFKSQVATSIEQSKRLLALGLKKETADMTIHIKKDNSWYVTAEPFFEWEDDMNTLPSWEEPELIIPAWSLHRIIEILGPHRLPIHFRKKGRVDITVSYINPVHSGRGCYNYYDSIIDCIAWLIDQGYSYINPDYLEERK